MIERLIAAAKDDYVRGNIGIAKFEKRVWEALHWKAGKEKAWMLAVADSHGRPVFRSLVGGLPPVGWTPLFDPDLIQTASSCAPASWFAGHAGVVVSSGEQRERWLEGLVKESGQHRGISAAAIDVACLAIIAAACGYVKNPRYPRPDSLPPRSYPRGLPQPVRPSPMQGETK